MEIVGSLFLFERNIITSSREPKWQILRFMHLYGGKKPEWQCDVGILQKNKHEEQRSTDRCRKSTKKCLTTFTFILALGTLPNLFGFFVIVFFFFAWLSSFSVCIKHFSAPSRLQRLVRLRYYQRVAMTHGMKNVLSTYNHIFVSNCLILISYQCRGQFLLAACIASVGLQGDQCGIVLLGCSYPREEEEGFSMRPWTSHTVQVLTFRI